MKKMIMMVVTVVMLIAFSTNAFALDVVKRYKDGDIVTYFDEYETAQSFRNAVVVDDAVIVDVYIVNVKTMEVERVIEHYVVETSATWPEVLKRLDAEYGL